MAAHVPGRGGRRDEVGTGVEGDRPRERVDAELGQREALRRGAWADRVERDVDASRSLDHVGEVLLHGVHVQRVDACRLGDAAGGDDVLGDRVQLRQVAPVRKSRAPSRANARATAPPIAPPAA